MNLKLSTFIVLLMSAITLTTAQTAGTRPNILIILADDLGYADVGFNRDASYPEDRGVIPTPHLDALADYSIICSNAHVAHPFCGPSRAAIMTGMYPHRIGAQYNLPNDITDDKGIPVSETYFSTLIDETGYNTAAFGKWHLGFEEGKYQPMDRGFDEFFGFLGGGKAYFQSEYDNIWYKWSNSNANHAVQYNDPNQWNTAKGTVKNEYQDPLQRNREYVDRKEFALDEYLTDILTDEAIDFINRKAADADPFMMYLAYNAPHTPLEAPQEEIDAFKLANPNFESLIRNSTYITASTPVTKETDPVKKQALIDKFVDARITYATMVTNMDTNIGRIVAKLNETGEMDNTVIVFFSDNGGYTYSKGAVNYPLAALKGSVDEGGHRVPFFVHWPNKITEQAHYPYQISSMDLYPTLVSLAGGTVPATKTIDGVNFMDKMIAGEDARPGEVLHVLRPQNGFHNAAIISYPYRIVRKGGNGQWKLYHVDVNPEQQLTGVVDNTTADAIIAELERKGADWVREFADVKPAWFDHDRGDGHPHRIHWFGEDLAGNTADPIFPGFHNTYNDPTLDVEDIITSLYHIYPNPSNDSFHITFDTSINNLELSLYTTSGKLIKKIESSYVQETSVDATELKSGMYILKVKADDNLTIEKVIKI
ncbi:sulfatase-like hydrolase/transferase [Labilibacter marinus]|uniref:sulfatase-like hydrolase/transferase n=1 Tax=Labilibacter marinus TaxID=1477105 RepID=UPI0009FB4E0B|nr:sulfatase-like hydrolase/transferase [Labilibacter marinus]